MDAVARIEAAASRWNVLEHPFYQRWTAGELTQSAIQHYNNAQDALKRSDWTTYGREIEAMKSDLDQLAIITGAAPALPSPSPGASPTP